MRQAEFIQQAGEAFLELGEGILQVGSREFLGANFQQEGLRFFSNFHRLGNRIPDTCCTGFATGLLQPGKFLRLPLRQEGFGSPPGEIPHSPKECLPLGDANCTARIQHVKGVGAFQNVIVGRQHQPLCQGNFRFGFEKLVHLAQPLHIRHFKVIFRMFIFTH